MRETHSKTAKEYRLIYDGWRKISEFFGYCEYFPPMLEPFGLYQKNTSEEILREQMYTLKDKKGGHIALRPELTPTVSRMITNLRREKEFKAPVRWYSIADMFRYENTQKGRRRQFTQWNADIFGISDVWAEAEIIQVIAMSMTYLGFNRNEYSIHVNDKRMIESILRAFGARTRDIKQICILLDKRKKLNEREFKSDLKKYGIDVSEYDMAVNEIPPSINTLYSKLPASIPVVYNQEIVRGFDYYTGIVFEVFATDKENSRSIAGGGRYDSLAGNERDPIPAVGFAMGDEVLHNICVKKDINVKPIPVCLVTTKDKGTEKQALYEVTRLRNTLGISASYFPSKEVTDVYKYAEQQEVPYVAVRNNTSTSYRDIKKRKNKRSLLLNDVKKYL